MINAIVLRVKEMGEPYTSRHITIGVYKEEARFALSYKDNH
jgi:hypothetical protein